MQRPRAGKPDISSRLPLQLEITGSVPVKLINLRTYDKTINGFIAIHRLFKPHPSFGATRIIHYDSESTAQEDAIRLARLMSYKNAISGLPYGGAKGVIVAPSHIARSAKEQTLRAYADIVNKLGGIFVTGADAGISGEDVIAMRNISPYFVGVRSDPVYYTAYGVALCLREALHAVFGSPSLNGRSIAIQGLGKVGSALLEMVYGKAAKIFITDISSTVVRHALKKFPKVKYVRPGEIYEQRADIFSPCALGGVLNSRTVPKLRYSIVMGSANNQLAHPGIGGELFAKDILYGPDYAVNAGGLICVTDEYENETSDDRRLKRKIAKISEVFARIIAASLRERMPTNLVADRIAERTLAKNYA